jgi:hypothetical protein
VNFYFQVYSSTRGVGGAIGTLASIICGAPSPHAAQVVFTHPWIFSVDNR